MRTYMRVIVAVTALSLALVGCAKAKTAVKAPKRNVVAVTTSEYAFAVSDTITGGTVRLELNNTGGKQPHEAQFLRIDGHTMDEAATEVGKLNEGGARPDWLVYAGGVGMTKAGGSGVATFDLPAGTYALFCFVSDEGQENAPPHFVQGMKKQVTVQAGAEQALPETRLSIPAKDHSFEVPAITGGTHEVLFPNQGKEGHLWAALVFEQGVDQAKGEAAVAALLQGQQAPGVAEPENAFSVAAIEGGASVVQTVEFLPGRTYVLICYLPDKAGGQPHVAKGMAEVFSVA